MLEFKPVSGDASSVLVRGGPFWRRVLARGAKGPVSAARPVAGLSGIAAVEEFVRSPAAIRALGDALASDGVNVPAWVSRAIERIERGRVSSLSALAESLGVNRAHFARAFVAHVGFAPSEFRSIVRVCGAMRGIERGDTRLERTARRVGYAHQSHMTREFRAMLGMTPSQWRWRAFASA